MQIDWKMNSNSVVNSMCLPGKLNVFTT